MPASDHILALRAHVGTMPLLLPSATVVVRDADTVLAGLHRDHGRWLFPGGCIDPGESPADAATREVYEETGLTVQLTRLIGVFGGGSSHRVNYPNGDVVDYISTLFEARVTGGELRPDETELAELRWLTPAEVERLPVMPWMREALNALKSGVAFEPSSWVPG